MKEEEQKKLVELLEAMNCNLYTMAQELVAIHMTLEALLHKDSHKGEA